MWRPPVARRRVTTWARRAWRSPMAFVQSCQGIPGSTPAFGTLPPPNGNIWIGGNPGSCMMWDAYNHFMPPTASPATPPTDGNTGGYASVPDAFPPASNHPGGVNICFADGSVHFIKNSVNLLTWWALGTRDGDEIVSARFVLRTHGGRDGENPCRPFPGVRLGAGHPPPTLGSPSLARGDSLCRNHVLLSSLPYCRPSSSPAAARNPRPSICRSPRYQPVQGDVGGAASQEHQGRQVRKTDPPVNRPGPYRPAPRAHHRGFFRSVEGVMVRSFSRFAVDVREVGRGDPGAIGVGLGGCEEIDSRLRITRLRITNCELPNCGWIYRSLIPKAFMNSQFAIWNPLSDSFSKL